MAPDDQAASVDDSCDEARRRRYKETVKLCGAILELSMPATRARGRCSRLPFDLALGHHGGAEPALNEICPSADVKMIGEQILPSYRAMVLAALSAAAGAANNPDVAAPITDPSINAFHATSMTAGGHSPIR